MVNDVNGLRADGAINIVAKAQVPVCVMHMLGAPKTMQQAPRYNDVVAQITAFLTTQISSCTQQGIALEDIVVDPGIGFGKTLEHNLSLLKGVNKLKHSLACHVLIGVSRKSMIDQILDRQVSERLFGSVGLSVQSVINGAKIVRVHDVQETHDAIRSVEAVLFS